MSRYNSRFAKKIEEYNSFREAIGFSDQHAKTLRRFDAYCSEFQPDAAELTRDVVRGWFDYELKISGRNLSGKGTAIRSFARYVSGNSYVLPPECIPKKQAFVPYVPDDNELFAFFEAVDSFHDDKDPLIGITFSVLLRLIYSCGLRPREGRVIRSADIDFDTGELFVRKSKKRKDRIVVASDAMLGLLKEYRLKRSMWCRDGEDAFFIDASSRPIEPYRLNMHVKKCWAAATPGVLPGNLPNLRPYDLRHRFASELLQKWLDEGKDLYAMLPYMRAYMGHVRFEDTAYYIHLLPERLISSPGVDWEAIDSIGLGDDIWND